MKRQIDFKNQKILVTGGSRGIGRQLVRDFSELGAQTYFTSTTPTGHENNIAIDFTNDSRQKIEKFLEKIGSLGLHVCVNNAGTNVIGPIDEYPKDEWDRIIKLNLTIPFEIIKAIVPGMKKRGYGKIVNITSISSEISMPLRSAYCSSKFGLLGLSKVVAVELARDGILVNAVGPGVTETELTVNVLGRKKMKEIAEKIPAQRLGTVEDVSNVVMFMASKMNTYVVGQNIIVDGGYVCV